MRKNFIIGYNTAVKHGREGRHLHALTRGENLMPQQFSHRNGEIKLPTVDGLYWIKGEAIIREKMWPYEHRQRIAFGIRPYEISGGLIDMGNDVSIPVEWVTGKSMFYGPIIPPWEEK